MIRFGSLPGRVLSLTLCLGMTIPQASVHATEAFFPGSKPPVVTKAIQTKASMFLRSGEAFRTRIIPKLEEYSSDARIQKIGYWSNEIIQFQALLIIMSSTLLESIKEQKELEALGQKPTSNESGQPLCSAKTTNPNEAILCSGEFAIGTLTGAGMIGANHLATSILMRIFKNTAGRTAMMRLVLGAFSTVTMAAANAYATFLWTQATRLITDNNLSDHAKGVAGRAMLAFASGNGSSFMASDDGKALSLIMNNMFKIAVVDSDLRNDWFYNGWRFGLARGEAVSSIFAMMGAAAIQPMTFSLVRGGATLVTAAGAAGTGAVVTYSAAAITFFICTAMGILALDVLVNYGVPKSLTEALQNSRLVVDNAALYANRNLLQVVGEGFRSDDIRLRSTARTEYVNAMSEKRLAVAIPSQYLRRNDVVSVLVEKFYELLTAKRDLENRMEIAEKSIDDLTFTNLKFVQWRGQILTYADGQKIFCNDPSLKRLCRPPTNQSLAYKKQALMKLKPALAEADSALADLAQAMTSVYDEDIAYVSKYFAPDAQYSMGSDLNVAIQFKNFLTQSQLMSQSLKLTLSALSPSVQQRLGQDPPRRTMRGLAEDLAFEKTSKEDITQYYYMGFDENVLTQALGAQLGLQTQ